ncbi:hypothetical protein IFM89_030910 [Coptis chinensis]|uniref:TF-B3 domain-containing protein n=1 Tax=Coptis chinensis TaxID=261450 RepID=A0A835LTF6_9MAGN|nr:hypothetical protein IFM89_030910 [Coptis chinensis]
MTDRTVYLNSFEHKQVFAIRDIAKICGMKSAEKVQANLDPRFPSFVKALTSVTCGCVRIPAEFCSLHLPKHDFALTLVDENRAEYLTTYLHRRKVLSRGWRSFSTAHKLVKGDILVFHLVKDATFQLYIIRAYSGLSAIGGVVGHHGLDSHPNQTSMCKDIKAKEETCKRGRKRLKTALRAVRQPPTVEKSRSDNEEFGLVVLKRVRLSEKTLEFKDMKDLDSFTIAVNGLNIDSKFSKNDREKYYELCRSQDTFLHDNLREGINIKLAAGAISETVDIADAIKASKLSSPQEDFAAWEKSLGVLEKLGMNVYFLRARLQQLFRVAFESEVAADSMCYRIAIGERARVEEEIRTVEDKLSELKTTSKRLDAEIEILEKRARFHELKYQTEVDSPW